MRNNKGKNNGMFGKKQSVEARLKMSIAKKGKNIGKKHSEETKKKMSLAHKGKKLSEKTKLKMSKSKKGIIFSKQHRKNLSIVNSGKNNPMYGIHLLGEKNGMFGKKHSKETIEKLRIISTGKIHSKATKIKMSLVQKGEKNHFYNKNHSKRVRKKLSIIHTGKVLTQKHKDNIGKAFTGEKHPNWKGGNKLYALEFISKLKHFIKRRDNYTCRLCSGKHKNQDLHVHHIDYDKFNSNPNNLITLCNTCHSKTNYNRNFWAVHLLNILIAEDLLDEYKETSV